MKRTKITSAIVATIGAGIIALNAFFAGSVKGTITPADSALNVWAVSATDTFRTTVTNGFFEIKNVKPGTYKIMVEASAPFKSATKEQVVVKDNEQTDVGEIRLEQ